tara:strand:+ start:667 stop:1167 length:501 start_codon:yes stop_codon:yes gene_type:complete
MGFMDNYEPVADRIAKFWEKYPQGRIHTEIKLINETEIVIMASIFTDREDLRPAAIDFAQETRGSSAINKTSFVENCSTSAIGRSLSALNFQSKKDGKPARPSREEMIAVSSQAIDGVVKDLEGRASVLALSSDVEGLRELYSEAKNAGAPKSLLDQITEMAKALG